jgi:hypothetical protein
MKGALKTQYGMFENKWSRNAMKNTGFWHVTLCGLVDVSD